MLGIEVIASVVIAGIVGIVGSWLESHTGNEGSERAHPGGPPSPLSRKTEERTAQETHTV